MQAERTAFISYRRTNIYMARAVYQDLTANGYDVFLDYESIDAGSFEQVILNQIAARAHFIVILTPSALERCTNPDDWLRREIEYALEMKRNIVPLMFDRFSFGDVQKYLTGKLAVLPQYNALNIPPDYFEAAMDKLRGRFLNKPLDVILHPTPKTDETAVKQAQVKEAAQPAVSEDQLTAEQWLERGLKLNDNSEEEIACYTQAIQLAPQFALAYNNRGAAYFQNGDLERAAADYNDAIRLDPHYAESHYNRGNVFMSKDDMDGAIANYNEAIRLNRKHVNAYHNRGVAYKNKGDLAQAKADYQRYVDLGGPEAEKLREWIRDIDDVMQNRE